MPWWKAQQNERWSQGGGNNQSSGAWGAGSWRQGNHYSNWNQQEKQGQWTCPDLKCAAACKKAGCGPWQSPMGEDTCRACGGPKPKDPAGGSKLQAIKAELAGSGKKTYLQAAAPAALASGTAAASTVTVTVQKEEDVIDIASCDGEEAPTTVLALPEEFVVIARLLHEPRPLAQEWYAKTELEKRMPQKKGKADPSRTEEELCDLKNLLALQVKKMANGLPAATEKRIEFAEKRLQKMEEEGAAATPPTVIELEWVREQAEKAEDARVAKTDASAVKSEERANRLEEICKEQLEAWEAHLLVIQAERSSREASWQARRMLLEGRALEVQELAQHRISLAKEIAGCMDTDGAEEDSNEDSRVSALQKKLDLVTTEAAEAATKAAEAAATEKNSLLQRLEALEKQMLAAVSTSGAAASQPAQAVQTAQQYTMEAAAQCNRTISYSAADLPELKTKPPAAYKKNLVLIATNLRHWEQYGLQPVTYAHLLSGAGDQKATSEAFRTLQDLAGEKVWKRVYGDSTVTDGQFVPFQMREILISCLQAAEKQMTEFAKLCNYEDESKARFLELHEEDNKARKGRTGPYSAF